MKKIVWGFLISALLGGCITRYAYGIYQAGGKDDPVQDGMYRIVDDQGRIGYADESLSIIIFPQYAFGYPFFGNRAKVTNGCSPQVVWGSKEPQQKCDGWFYIDRYGNRLPD